MTLFFFLANTLLILIVIYALRFPIILFALLLWKLRHALLGLVALLGLIIYMDYHNRQLDLQASQASHPAVVYKDSATLWLEAHPEVVHPVTAPTPTPESGIRDINGISESEWRNVLLPTIR